MRTPRPDRPKLTVVTPVFNEAGNLDRYADEVSATLLVRDDMDTRVLFVDDGSADDSWARIEQIAARDARFSGIRLSRNFGSHIALGAGFAGVPDDTDAVATLACDLQDPPTTVLEFVDAWRGGADIVWGARRERGDERWRVWASNMFTRLLRTHAMPRGSLFTTGSFLLMDRTVLQCVQRFKEHNRITFALVAWTGFEQAQVPYDRRQRVAGRSGWSFGRMVRTMYDAFVGFSTLPTRVITTAAFVAFLIAAALVGYLLVIALLGSPVPGWTSQMLLLSGFFGVQFSLTAIMGEYLHRIHAEVLHRPLYFVSDSTGPSPTGPDRPLS